MNWGTFSDSTFVQHLGWTLAHSIWQLALIAGFLFIALRLFVGTSANARYFACVLALSFSAIVPVMTFLQVSQTVEVGYLFPRSAHSFQDEIPAVPADEGRVRAIANGEGSFSASHTVEQRMVGLSKVSEFINDVMPNAFPIAVVTWMLGILMLSLRLFGGVWKLHEYRTVGISVADNVWQERFNDLRARLRIGSAVKLIRSELVKTPIAVGFFKPLIIVPASAFLQMRPDELECIIAHELIHIRRYDSAVNIFQSAAETVFFYHPAIWWISAEIRREREFAADAAVLAATGHEVVYASALANLEELRHLTNVDAPSMAMAANGGNLMQRIERILNKKTEASRANSVWSTGMALALASILLLALFSFTPRSVVNGQKRDTGGRKLAVGFVSIPPVDRSNDPPRDADATERILIAKLHQNKVPAIGFLSGGMVSDGEKLFPVRADIARMWRDAGFEVGIGGFKHIWFYETPYDDFVANVEKNQAVARMLFSDKEQPRYFCYPYLNTGRSAEERDKFESWLNSHGLTSVKYTIDNNEWMFSYAYDMARNDNDVNTMKEIRTAFIDYMSRMFDHYEKYSSEMFGRDIAQTMVLTPSRLVADSADDLFGMIKKRGYQFVTMSDAQADAAYQSSESFFGNSGISWFERWRMKQGQQLLDEPKVDPLVQKIWDAKKMSEKADVPKTVKKS
jgi:beta-lactamase regulating signal transducer with metallopeptidase domain/peptidoglycan/xylan/chitin deacetylase (PgdA/CDA1 family)